MTQYVLSLSYGKDSMACIEACRLLGYPIDRIVTADVWATDTIQADLPPMVEFKEYADREIKKRYGITVEHFCAMRGGQPDNYERYLYKKREKGKFVDAVVGFPLQRNPWCNKLKTEEVDIRRFVLSSLPERETGGANLRVPDAGGQWCTGELKTRQLLHSTQAEGVFRCGGTGANNDGAVFGHCG